MKRGTIMRVCLLLALLGCIAAMIPEQHVQYRPSNAAPEDNGNFQVDLEGTDAPDVDPVHDGDEMGFDDSLVPAPEAEDVSDEVTVGEEENVQWLPASEEKDTDYLERMEKEKAKFMKTHGFNDTGIMIEWMLKKQGINMTKEEFMEVMGERTKNFTDSVLAYLNSSYHEMLKLPPKSSEPNSTSCKNRTMFVRRFLFNLYKLFKPFSPKGNGHGGPGHHGGHHGGSKGGFQGGKWGGWGQDINEENRGGRKGRKFGKGKYGGGKGEDSNEDSHEDGGRRGKKYGGRRWGVRGQDTNQESSEDGGRRGGNFGGESTDEKRGPQGGKGGHGKRGGEGGQGMSGGEGGQGQYAKWSFGDGDDYLAQSGNAGTPEEDGFGGGVYENN